MGGETRLSWRAQRTSRACGVRDEFLSLLISLTASVFRPQPSPGVISHMPPALRALDKPQRRPTLSSSNVLGPLLYSLTRADIIKYQGLGAGTAVDFPVPETTSPRSAGLLLPRPLPDSQRQWPPSVFRRSFLRVHLCPPFLFSWDTSRTG